MQQHVSPQIRNLTKTDRTHQKCSKEGVFRYLKPLSSSRCLSSYEGKWTHEPTAGSSSEMFPLTQSVKFYFLSQLFLVWLIPSLRLSPPLEVYSITGGKQFHPEAPPHSPFSCGEKVCGGATSCVVLSAGCKSTRCKGVCGGEKNGGRSCVFWAACGAQGEEPANYCLALQREMEEWKIWAATGVSLTHTFSKWVPAGVKSSLAPAAVALACGWRRHRGW